MTDHFNVRIACAFLLNHHNAVKRFFLALKRASLIISIVFYLYSKTILKSRPTQFSQAADLTHVFAQLPG